MTWLFLFSLLSLFFLSFLFWFSSILLNTHSKSQWHHQSTRSKIVFLVNLNPIVMLFKVLLNNVLVSNYWFLSIIEKFHFIIHLAKKKKRTRSALFTQQYWIYIERRKWQVPIISHLWIFIHDIRWIWIETQYFR